MNKFQRRIRYYKLRFLRLKGDPKSIARGVALGTFIGITPTMPLHTIATLLVAPLIRANLIGAFIAGWAACNPLTYFLQYYLSWLIGNALTPYNLSWQRIKTVMDVLLSHGASLQIKLHAISQLGADAVIVMVLGGAVLATPFTIAAYFMTFRFFTKLRQKRGPAGLPLS
jgi:uncharacterized protein (DUF2062 family)